MFSTQEQLDKKTGPYGIGRLSYLQSLVTEFQDTSSLDSKQQVLANLANFAYDPINYDHFRTLNVIDLFLDAVEETDEKLVEFAIGGICNCCLDKENKEYILKNNGVQLVIKCLSSQREDTVLSAITTLMYLTTPLSKSAPFVWAGDTLAVCQSADTLLASINRCTYIYGGLVQFLLPTLGFIWAKLFQ